MENNQLSASKKEAMEKSDVARSRPDSSKLTYRQGSSDPTSLADDCAAMPEPNTDGSAPAVSRKSPVHPNPVGVSGHHATETFGRKNKLADCDQATQIATERNESQLVSSTKSDFKAAAKEQEAVLRYVTDDAFMDISPMPPTPDRQQNAHRSGQPGAHAVCTPRRMAHSDLARGLSNRTPTAAEAAAGVRSVDPELGDNSSSIGAGLIEADPIMDGSCRQQARPVAKPSHSRAWQIYLLAAIGIFLFLGGVLAGGVCAGGLYHKSGPTPSLSDPVNSTTAHTRDKLEAAIIERDIQAVLGHGYFGSGSDSELKARQKARHWIQYEDPLQLNSSDAQHLLQRFTLVLFYFQTTQKEKWTECNPLSHSSAGLCYYPEGALHSPSTEWGSPWLSGDSECQWAGVLCNEDKRVKELRLRHNGLNGPLPWEISKLTQLQTLDLQRNALTGTLPTELGLLIDANLTNLILKNNMLEGIIPTELFVTHHSEKMVPSRLYLRRNLLTGSIPTQVGISKWMTLDFGYNSLSGSLPAELFILSKMEWFLIVGNKNVAGTVPAQIGQLSKLRGLDLGETGMSGTVPSEVALLSELQMLHLSDSKIGGTLPEALYSGLVSLAGLSIAGCYFSGTINPSVGSWTNLGLLRLADNQFSGTIPEEIGRLTNLHYVTLNGNNFTSRSVPEELCANRGHGAFFLSADCTQDPATGIAAMECPAECCTICCDPKTKICLEN